MSASELALLEEERDQLREECDELLKLVKRVKNKIAWLDSERDEWYFIALDIDKWLNEHVGPCPECGNRPPTICKMSCNTRTY